MQQISSQLNLVFRNFLPLFITTMLTLFAVSLVYIPVGKVFGLPVGFLKFFVPGVLFAFVSLWYLKLRKLYRVDASAEHVYISDYNETVRYKHSDVATLRRRMFGPFEVITLELVEAGKFGQYINFLASRRRISLFAKDQPDLEILYRAAIKK